MKIHYFKFLPLLLFYALLVIIFSSETFVGDESGYIRIASYLVGKTDKMTLWWGPGYLIILAPFIALDLPLLQAKFLNVVFLFGAVLYFYSALTFWLNDKYAIFLALTLGLYPPFWREVYFLLTENLVFFLSAVSCFIS